MQPEQEKICMSLATLGGGDSLRTDSTMCSDDRRPQPVTEDSGIVAPIGVDTGAALAVALQSKVSEDKSTAVAPEGGTSRNAAITECRRARETLPVTEDPEPRP